MSSSDQQGSEVKTYRPVRQKTFSCSDDELVVRQQINSCFQEGWTYLKRENAADGQSFTITFTRPEK